MQYKELEFREHRTPQAEERENRLRAAEVARIWIVGYQKAGHSIEKDTRHPHGGSLPSLANNKLCIYRVKLHEAWKTS